MDRLTLDTRAAWRSIGTQRGATGAIIVVLTLGVGLVTTMFALADPFVAKPLPYPSPRQLVFISATPLDEHGNPTLRPSFMWSDRQGVLPTVREWKARRDLFQDLAFFDTSTLVVVRLHPSDRTIALRGFEVSPGTLRMLGQREEPCRATAPSRCVMLMASTVEREFSGRDDLSGRWLPTPTGSSVHVTGILGRTFVFPVPYDAGSAVFLAPEEEGDQRPVSSARVLARVQPGVSMAHLQSALLATASDPRRWTVRVESLENALTKYTRAVAWGALAAGLLILLVCTGNVANLLFSRGMYRGTEFATRTALGASKRDLARLLLLELIFVTILAVGAGIGLAAAILTGLRNLIPSQYTLLGEAALTIRVGLFAAVVGLVVVVLSAMLAWLALRTQSVAGFGGESLRGVGTGRALRCFIIMAQCSVAMILVTGAALLGRSYMNLFGQDTGFSGSAVAVTASYPRTLFGEPLAGQIQATIEALKRLPGIERVGASVSHVQSGLAAGRFKAGGPPMFVDGRPFEVFPQSVTDGFFEAAGTPVLSGRTLTAADAGQPYVVINESFARQAWPNRPALGGGVQSGNVLTTVIGVVKDTFERSLDSRPVPTMYWLRVPGQAGNFEWAVSYVVRPTDPARDMASLAARVISANTEAVITNTSSIQERLAGSVAERVFATLMVSLFASAAVAICTAGLVGVVAFITARRTREIAIRIAIGAQPTHVFALVAGETLAAATMGILLGLVGARFGSIILQRLTYEVALNTWVTGMPAGLAMLLLASITLAVAARRALRLPVVAALRME